MKDLKTLLNDKNELKSKANEIIDSCKKEIRGMTEEEVQEMEDLKNRILALEEEIGSLTEERNDSEEDSEEVCEKEEEVRNDSEEDTEEVKEEVEEVEEEKPEEPEEKEEERKNKNIENKKMEKRFSILTAIKNIANNTPQDEVTSAVLAEGNAEMRKAGLNFVGQIQIPSEVRSLTVADEGEDVVATDFLDVVKPLQARNVLIQAGAKYVTGLVGDIQYPVMSNGSCTWEDEVAEAKDGSVSFTNVKLSPKRMTVVVPISKQFLIQDSVGAENAIREEIINAINAKLEATILGSGAGSANEPAGLLNGVTNTVSDFEGLCNLEATLEEANVYGNLKYIVSPKAKAALRNMAKSSKSTQLVYENGEIDGTEAMSTSHVKESNFVYGDFSQYIIAQWGTLDITVDNVTLAAKGQIRLVVNAYFDAKPLRAAAFVTGKLGE